MRYRIIVYILLLGYSFECAAQDSHPKQIDDKWISWVSINSTLRVNDRWGAIMDLHVRRNNVVSNPGFYFIRAGASYWLNNHLSLVIGYAHMWLAQGNQGWEVFANERRLYEQITYSSKIGKVSILNRLRDEHRWREQTIANSSVQRYVFSNRLRHLLSLGIPLSSKPFVPQISIATEWHIQFGSPVVYNTFDQLRLFGGIRQHLGGSWSFDTGYMLVYQQKAAGFAYSRLHTVRLFFYYNLDKRRPL